MRVFLCGLPLPCGGANQEAGDTALLWRRAGLDVTVLAWESCHCGRHVAPTSGPNPWLGRLASAGIPIVKVRSGEVWRVDGLRENPVVSFCNTHFLHNFNEFLSLCPKSTVWSPTMNYVSLDERRAFELLPPSVIHYQSHFQAKRLRKEHSHWNWRGGGLRGAVIPGAFEPLAKKPRRRVAGEPFVVGKLSRPDWKKWNDQWWPMLQSAKDRVPELEALCMAWSPRIETHCGSPPEWAHCLHESTLDTQTFLEQCHVLVAWNSFAAVENWPRIGLEAMSVGVPLIVESKGGWPEMGHEGVLYADDAKQFANLIVSLAQAEGWRQEMIRNGAIRLTEIVEPDYITRKWVELFSKLGG